MSISKKRRVSRELFSFLFDKSKFVGSKNFYLKVFDYPKAGHTTKENILKLGYNGLTLFGFVSPKKEFPKAVLRNKAKRRSRSAVYKLLDNIHEGFVCFFFLKKGVNSIDFKEFETEIKTALNRAGVLKSF